MSADEPLIFDPDRQLRLARALAKLPYTGGLHGLHGVESFEDLIVVLERFAEQLVDHAQRDEARDATLAKHEAALRGLRLFLDLVRPEGV